MLDHWRPYARPILFVTFLTWLAYTAIITGMFGGSFLIALAIPPAAFIPDSVFGFHPRGRQADALFIVGAVLFLVLCAIAWLRRMPLLAASLGLFLLLGMIVAYRVIFSVPM